MEFVVCGDDLKESGDNTWWCHVSGERKGRRHDPGQRRRIGGGRAWSDVHAESFRGKFAGGLGNGATGRIQESEFRRQETDGGQAGRASTKSDL